MAKEKKKANKKKNGSFYPIPQNPNLTASFANPAFDGVAEKAVVNPAGAGKRAVPTDKAVASILMLPPVAPAPKQVCGTISLGRLCRHFAPGSYVNLTTLKYLGLVREDCNFLTVKAKGKLDRKLMVEAHQFDTRAVRMLYVTGGRAISYKPEEPKSKKNKKKK